MDDLLTVVEPSPAGLVGQEFGLSFILPCSSLEWVEVFDSCEGVPPMDVEGVRVLGGEVGQDIKGIDGFRHGDVVSSTVALSPGPGVLAVAAATGKFRFIGSSGSHQWGWSSRGGSS